MKLANQTQKICLLLREHEFLSPVCVKTQSFVLLLFIPIVSSWGQRQLEVPTGTIAETCLDCQHWLITYDVFSQIARRKFLQTWTSCLRLPNPHYLKQPGEKNVATFSLETLLQYVYVRSVIPECLWGKSNTRNAVFHGLTFKTNRRTESFFGAKPGNLHGIFVPEEANSRGMRQY